MKKILTKAIATLLILSFMAVTPVTTAIAAEEKQTAKDQIDALKNMQFDVTKHLNLGQACKVSEDCPTKSDGTNYECKNGYCDVQNMEYFTKEKGPFPVFNFILNVIELLTKIAGTIAVIMLIMTGFMMMFAQGNQNTMEKAKQMFIYEIIGMIVILLSYIMVTVVQSIFTL